MAAMAGPKIFVFCLLLISAAAAQDTQSSNQTSPGETRIVGGIPDDLGELWFVCSLVLEGSIFCGCSIISPHSVLTTTSCMGKVPEHSDIKIIAGSIQATEGLAFEVTKIDLHPKYDSQTMDYDVAVLHTTVPIVGPKISYIRLPLPFQYEFPDQILVVAGYGATSPQGNDNSVLKKAFVDRVAQPECQAAYLDQGKVITPRMLCAAAPGRDTCTGDGGDPLFVFYHLNAVFVQYGVASFGSGCADPKYPGVYTRLTPQLIRQFIYDVSGV